MAKKFVRMGHPPERQLASNLEPKDIDRGTDERNRLNRIKTKDELAAEVIAKAERKAAKPTQAERRAARARR